MTNQQIIDKHLDEFNKVQKIKIPIELNSYLHRMINEALEINGFAPEKNELVNDYKIYKVSIDGIDYETNLIETNQENSLEPVFISIRLNEMVSFFFDEYVKISFLNFDCVCHFVSSTYNKDVLGKYKFVHTFVRVK